LNRKNIVAGMGEIGKPILEVISKENLCVGYDINSKLMNKKRFQKYVETPALFLHICIPFNKKFLTNVTTLYNKFRPEIIVIHSTIEPKTTRRIQKNLPVPVIYSATRGIHKRMRRDLQRYTKYFAVEHNAPKKSWAIQNYKKLLRSGGIKSKQMSDPLTLELAKILVDTSYYGWLITYAQLTNMIAIKNKINYNEMWEFSDEIHEILGNRPKMYPGFIGGHCVIPNLELISENTLNLIKEINSDYAKTLKRKPKKK
jgi:hypothetical protein